MEHYRYSDQTSMEVYFSFNEIERSVQVKLSIARKVVAVLSEEFGTRITMQDDRSGEYLLAEFHIAHAAKSKLELRLKPQVSVNWDTLESTTR